MAQGVFWWFWTLQPGNWEQLRQQWEYSHLAGALFQALTLSALIIAMLARSPKV